MTRLDEAIIDFVRRNGPSTPLEVAPRIGSNSIIVSAVMIDAVTQKKLMRSKRKIGSYRLFYYPGQEQALQKRITATLTPQDKTLIDRLMKENVIGEFEVSPAEAAVLANLEDMIVGFAIDHNGRPLRCWAVPKLQEQKARELAKSKLEAKVRAKPAVATPAAPEALKPAEPAKPEPKAPAGSGRKGVKARRGKEKEREKIKQQVLAELKEEFRDDVLGWFEKQDIDVQNEKTIKEGKEYELEAKLPTPLGKQAYLVRVVDLGKKKAGKDLLSKIGLDAVGRRTPVIVISKTGFAKTATKYCDKELDHIMKLVSKDDLEL